MVRGNGRDRIQVYARIVHQLTSERMKPILEHCVWGPPTRQQKEPFNAILTRPGSYKSMISSALLKKVRIQSWAVEKLIGPVPLNPLAMTAEGSISAPTAPAPIASAVLREGEATAVA